MEGINLEKLEAVVEKMLNNINDLKKNKAMLEAQLEARNTTIAELEAKLDSMVSSQEEVSSRVTNLLSSIEDWERTAEPETHETYVEEHEGHEGNNERNDGSLFSIGE